jgi:Type II secretion system (T2SS), protein E, N-terminal domain
MTARLGQMLVEEGACSEAAIREALQNQAIFGGRLGTNLLELGAVTEEALALALGAQTGSPALYGDLPPDPKALRLVDKRVADRWDVVPYLVADRKLAVLARDPRDIRMLDEVAFAAGRSVHPFVVPEARVWQTLRSAYGIDREHRGLSGSRRAPTPSLATPPSAGPLGPELMDEAEFDALYGRDAGSSVPPLGLRPDPPPAGLLGPAASDAPPPLTLELLEVVSEARGHAPPKVAPPSSPAPRPDVVEPSPLSFADALRFLEGVEDRATIARTVLRHARSRFARILLLTVRHGGVHGWAGLGGGLTPEAVHAIRIPLGLPGVLDTVVATQAHFLGPLPKTRSNIRLLKGLGGGVPGNALLIPILARGRVVNVLYGDNGRGEVVDAGGLGELLVLAARIAKSYDALASRAV